MKKTSLRIFTMSAVLSAAFAASGAKPASAEDVDRMAERLGRVFDRAELPMGRWDQVFNRMDLGGEGEAEVEAPGPPARSHAKVPFLHIATGEVRDRRGLELLLRSVLALR